MRKSLTLALLVTLGLGVMAAPAGAAPRYLEYVALGDSWSADVVFADSMGLPDSTHAPIGCAQSRRNYPKLLASALQVPSFRDATCGSATTDHFYAPQSELPTGETNPPQFERLTKTTDLVTVGIGGNDAGFAGAAVSCINVLPTNTNAFDAVQFPVSLPLLGFGVPIGGCKQRFVKDGRDLLAEQIDASEQKLVRALEEIHRLSPKAKVLMLDYLDAIPPKGCYPLVPITDEDMAYLHETFKKLNAMVRRAAAQGGATFVDSYADSHGRDVCQPPTVRYVEGLGILSVNDVAVAVPAHPNSAGAAQQFRSMLKAVNSLGENVPGDIVPGDIVPGGEAPAIGGSAACGGSTVTHFGTSGNDVITGTEGNDVIASGGGNDTVLGVGGNDIVCGGAGNDTVKGGAGKDKLYGDAGRDKLRGGAGRDSCVGGLKKDSAKKCERVRSL